MSNNKVKLAAIQMLSSFVLEDNLEQAKELIAEAVKQGARLLLLPENFAMFQMSEFSSLAENEEKDAQINHFLSEQSSLYGIVIVAGSLPVKSDKAAKVFSRCLVFDRGVELAHYDKIHLFDVDVADAHGQYRESSVIEAGAEVVVVEVLGLRVGLAICYDLRFPELFRQMSRNGLDLLLLPAAFTFVTGKKHWELLLRARAIENQCYVLAANQGGEHLTQSGAMRETYGHSMLIDADGEVLEVLPRGKGVVIGELDLAKMQALRSAMPVLQHRKL